MNALVASEAKRYCDESASVLDEGQEAMQIHARSEDFRFEQHIVINEITVSDAATILQFVLRLLVAVMHEDDTFDAAVDEEVVACFGFDGVVHFSLLRAVDDDGIHALFKREAKQFLLGCEDLFAGVPQHANAHVGEGQHRRLVGDVRHARRVTGIVNQLVDGIPGCGTHRCTRGLLLRRVGRPDLRAEADQRGQRVMADLFAEGVEVLLAGGGHVDLLRAVDDDCIRALVASEAKRYCDESASVLDEGQEAMRIQARSCATGAKDSQGY